MTTLGAFLTAAFLPAISGGVDPLIEAVATVTTDSADYLSEKESKASVKSAVAPEESSSAAAVLRHASDAVLVTADNRRISAKEISIRERDGKLVLDYRDSADRSASLPCRDVVEIGFGATIVRKRFSAADVQVRTTTGDLLFGSLEGPTKDEDGVRLRTAAYGTLELKFEQMSAMRFLANREQWPKKDPAFTGRNDLVVTRNNDQAEGTLNAIRRDHVDYYSKALRANKKLPLPDVSLIFFMAPTGAVPAPPKTLYALLTTTDGSILQGVLKGLEKGILDLTDLRGKTHRISTALLAGISFRNGRVVYLSDRTPSRVEENANYIRPADGKSLPSDLAYPWRRDQSAAETPMRIKGREFRKGIGVHAYSSLTFALDEPFTKFQASIGLDDLLRFGDVVFEVWVDERERFSARVKWGQPATDIDVDVAGAKSLRLVVDFGGNANIGDFADWGAARLIK